MITMVEALRLVEKNREDALVLPTMGAIRGWVGVSLNRSLDLPIRGGMGKTLSVALGLCLARPDKKVIVLDGDGSLLMNLGGLVTVGGEFPENFYHFVLDNGMYAATGGQPTPNAEGFSFAGIAKAAGYAAAFEFDDLEAFATIVDQVLSAKGPVLASIKTEPEIENRPIWARPKEMTPSTVEAIKGLRQMLGRTYSP